MEIIEPAQFRGRAEVVRRLFWRRAMHQFGVEQEVRMVWLARKKLFM